MAQRYDALFVDLDGVVHRGEELLDHASTAIQEARRLGLGLLFLTNNSSKTDQQVVDKLDRLGVPAAPEEILTSGQAAADMLAEEGAAGRSAFVIGEAGVREALAGAGIRLLDGQPEHADLVVVGWDRQVDYDKLRVASLLVERGARLIATNADSSYPAPDGLWPGAGAILSAITTTTGATPTVVGKPHRPLFERARELTGARRPLVVGDRLDTDIAGAHGMGWDSLLVLTGATSAVDLPLATHPPTYVGGDLRVLHQDVPRGLFRKAGAPDLGDIRALLESSGLRADGTETRLASTLVCAGPNGRGIEATACLDQESGFGILRSVAVSAAHRAQGLGLLAVAAALAEARAAGIAHVSLFTESAAPFFARLGFREVPRSALPQAVQSSRHAAEECSVSATAMTLQLPAQG